MIYQEILKITRRRGLFWTAVLVTTAAPLLVIVIDLILHGSKPQSYSGGDDLLRDSLQSLILLSLVVFSILIGAQVGAWEAANRTFRYLVMSGRPRLLLYSMRIPALVAAITLVAAPAMLIAITASLLMPLDGFAAVDGASALDFAWELWLPAVVLGFLSFTIGALLQSVGAAIAVAMVTNFIGLSVLNALSLINDTLGDLMLPALLARVTGDDSSVSLAVSVLALAVWIAGLYALGAIRTVRSEY